jgi:hypothetical protein
LASDCAGKEKIGDVGAGNKKNEGHGTIEDEQWAANVANNLFEKRKDAEGQATIGRIEVWVLLAEAGGDGIHFGLGLRDGDAGLEAGDNVVVFVIAIVGGSGGKGERNDDFGEFGVAKGGKDFVGEGEILSENADDGEGLAVDAESLTENVGTAAVATGPGAVGEKGGGRLAEGVFIWSEEAAESGFGTEHGEEIRGEPDNTDALGRAIASEIFIATDGDGDLFQSGVVALDIEVLGSGEPVLRNVEARGTVPENDEAIRIGEWKRAKEQGVGDGKDGSIGANADGEGEDGGENEAGRAPEIAEGDGEVLAESGEHVTGIVVDGRVGEKRGSRGMRARKPLRGKGRPRRGG